MNKIAGFSLIEMAIGLVIIGLLIGSLLAPGFEQNTQQKIRTTQQTLEEIKEALLGFAEVNGRLPCPAIDLTGKEPADFADPAKQRCDTYDDADGYLPWAVLGVGKYDAWGRPFRYRVDGWFNNGPGIFDPRTMQPKPLSHPIGASRASLVVNNRLGKALNKAASPYNDVQKTLTYNSSTGEYKKNAATLNYPYVSNVVAIIFSCGKNGRPDGRPDASQPDRLDLNISNDIDGIVNSDALCTNPLDLKNPPAWDNNPKNSYVQDSYVEDQFDDILVWLPKDILIARLTAAGKWPPFTIY
jgi:type II secretory pathway pseudopilin PulG